MDDVDFLASVLAKGSSFTHNYKKKEIHIQKSPKKPVETISEAPTTAAATDVTAAGKVFKEGDIITHPKYGEGVIVRVEENKPANTLLVSFPDRNEEKRLSEKWVKDHCKYILNE